LHYIDIAIFAFGYCIFLTLYNNLYWRIEYLLPSIEPGNNEMTFKGH